MVFTFVLVRKWDFSRFFGLGGMPSSHAAVVCGLAAAVGISRGYYSADFAIAVVLAGVVMTDAAGVRRAAGKQAAVLNRIIEDMFTNGKGWDDEKLKELIGHTPVQVVAGALLGVLIGVLLG